MKTHTFCWMRYCRSEHKILVGLWNHSSTKSHCFLGLSPMSWLFDSLLSADLPFPLAESWMCSWHFLLGSYSVMSQTPSSLSRKKLKKYVWGREVDVDQRGEKKMREKGENYRADTTGHFPTIGKHRRSPPLRDHGIEFHILPLLTVPFSTVFLSISGCHGTKMKVDDMKIFSARQWKIEKKNRRNGDIRIWKGSPLRGVT